MAAIGVYLKNNLRLQPQWGISSPIREEVINFTLTSLLQKVRRRPKMSCVQPLTQNRGIAKRVRSLADISRSEINTNHTHLFFTTRPLAHGMMECF